MPYVNAVGKVLRESRGSTLWIGGSNPGVNVTGTAANETLTGGANQTLAGGLGDDFYGLTGAATVVELADGGVDTQSVWASATLADNVENLVMNGGYGWYGFGNELDNIVRGTGGSQQIDGKAGNDVLIGGTGADLFVMTKGEGSDLIVDFTSGSDRIKLAGYGFHGFEDVKAAAKQVGADTVLSLAGGESLVLTGVSLTSLVERDFLYAIDLTTFTSTFSDEFDSLSLAVNGGTWRTWYGHNASTNLYSRYHNDEAQVYTDISFRGTSNAPLGLNPFSVSAGVLTITASPLTSAQSSVLGGHSYSSGLITTETTFSQQYGYFEIRAALPEGQGMWPAFWLLPVDGSWPPEIDVFEMLGKDPDTVYFATHQVVDGQHTAAGGQFRIDTSQFHTYGVDWGPEVITYYVDGSAIGTVPTPASMHVPMYMLANLAVGGGWAGPPDTTTGTREMLVDYIRVYAKVPSEAGLETRGNDYLVGGLTADSIKGRSGNDVIVGGGGADTLSGGEGSDTFRYTITSDSPQGAGDYITDFQTNSDRLDLTALDTSALSLIRQGGFTYLFAATPTGAFQLTASGVIQGSDILYGNNHSVFIQGSSAGDVLIGSNQADPILGYGGNDVITGGGGADALAGGAGADVYRYLAVSDSDAAGYDNLYDFETGLDRIDLTPIGVTSISVLRQDGSSFVFMGTAGGAMQLVAAGRDINGSDFTYNGTFGTYLIGSAGNDTLVGSTRNDPIQAGAGNDILIGGAGADDLYGQAGADIFRYTAVSDSTLANSDRIQDFVSGTDKVDLSGVRTGTADAYGIAYSNGGSFLFVDVGGNGTNDMLIQFTNVTLTAADLIWAAQDGALEAEGKAFGFHAPPAADSGGGSEMADSGFVDTLIAGQGRSPFESHVFTQPSDDLALHQQTDTGWWI